MVGGERCRPDADLLQWLLEQGATDEQIQAAIQELSLDRVATDLVLLREAELSARDVAAQVGMDAAAVLDLFRSYGVTVPDADVRLFTEFDVKLIEGSGEAKVMRSDDGLALMRVVSTALDRVAEAAVALYVQGTEEQLAREDASPLVWSQKATRMTELALEMGVGMGVLFRHHLRQAIDRQRVSQAAVTSRDVAWHAVGFVDLVGSTALADKLDVSELREVVSQFEARAYEVASACGGRVVKFIGDEIMVSALDPAVGCRLMLSLVAACSIGEMQPRGGLAWGEVLFRSGDYYGREVNLASRLVDAAIPGEVLVDGSVVESGSVGVLRNSGLVFEPAGRRLLKGFRDPVAVWSVAGDDGFA